MQYEITTSTGKLVCNDCVDAIASIAEKIKAEEQNAGPAINHANAYPEANEKMRKMIEDEASLTQEYKELLAADGINLIFRKDALREVAKLAIAKHTGARGLRSIMETLMLDIMYTAPSVKRKRYIVTSTMVREKFGIRHVA